MKPHLGAVLITMSAALLFPVDATAGKATRDVLAEVDGGPITAAEVATAIGMPLYKLEAQIYEMKRQKLRQLVAEKLLAAEAAKRKISVAQLLERDVASKADSLSEAEIDSFYNAHKANFAAEENAGREQARLLLRAQRQAEAQTALLQRLLAQASVMEHLKVPVAPSIELPKGGVARGNDKAPVRIVEFTDFHCPYCKLAEATVTEVLAKFGDKVSYEHRDFPIARLHPEAPRAHLAARCAAEQEKFWPYHDKLFAGPAQSGSEQLRSYASESELDVEAFAQCLESGRHQAALQQDIEIGTRLGVTGTPTFFINGRMLVGAQPLARFVDVIEEELAKVGRTPASADLQANTHGAAAQ